MSWLPRLREAGWFKTGTDGPAGSNRFATHHLHLRLRQDMNGTGEWTLELSDCRTSQRVDHVYDNEHDARATVACIYALTRHLEPLHDRGSGMPERGRWETTSHDLSDADRRQLARFTKPGHV